MYFEIVPSFSLKEEKKRAIAEHFCCEKLYHFL